MSCHPQISRVLGIIICHLIVDANSTRRNLENPLLDLLVLLLLAWLPPSHFPTVPPHIPLLIASLLQKLLFIHQHLPPFTALLLMYIVGRKDSQDITALGSCDVISFLPLCNLMGTHVCLTATYNHNIEKKSCRFMAKGDERKTNLLLFGYSLTCHTHNINICIISRMYKKWKYNTKRVATRLFVTVIILPYIKLHCLLMHFINPL